MRSMTIFAGALFAGALGALLLAVPAASQSSQAQEEAEQKAEAAKLAADPTLSAAANAAFLANNLKQPGVGHTRTGLQFKILQNGFGSHPGGADTVEVYYTGKMINGKVFDGTSPGLPASFSLASGGLVAGWTEALQMMRVGDHWQIVIPANLGYGTRWSPGDAVPPNQTMIFDLRLLSTRPPPRKGEEGYVPQPGDQDDDQK